MSFLSEVSSILITPFLILLDCQCDPIGTYKIMTSEHVQLLCNNKKCSCNEGYSGKRCQCADGSYELNGRCQGISQF